MNAIYIDEFRVLAIDMRTPFLAEITLLLSIVPVYRCNFFFLVLSIYRIVGVNWGEEEPVRIVVLCPRTLE